MISLLVVNFRTAALAKEAVRTARAATSEDLQVVVVDNSCDASEAEALHGIADVLIVSRTNRGYAGAINDGRRACIGETIVISNPDVLFEPGAIDLLAGELDDKTVVAGPALFWDAALEWHLPPGDLLTAPQKIDEVLASRSASWADERDRRRFRRRVAFWSLDRTTRVPMLSGAVMAVRAGAFDDIGRFDERFQLYFEETDFLRRVSERRKHIVYVPASRCRHLYNQSASQTGDPGAIYAASERKYLEKWNGPWLAGVLKRLEKPLALTIDRPCSGSILIDREDVVVEASPLPTFATAAGHFPRTGEVSLPAEVRESLGSVQFYLRVVERATARVLATYRISP